VFIKPENVLTIGAVFHRFFRLYRRFNRASFCRSRHPDARETIFLLNARQEAGVALLAVGWVIENKYAWDVAYCSDREHYFLRCEGLSFSIDHPNGFVEGDSEFDVESLEILNFDDFAKTLAPYALNMAYLIDTWCQIEWVRVPTYLRLAFNQTQALGDPVKDRTLKALQDCILSEVK